MKNKKLKGFTLVELLVVIAILAVLATVSVVGYTSFITKANNSNALTECKQAEDIVLSDLISTGKEADAVKYAKVGDTTYEFKYSQGKGKVQITTATAPTGTTPTDIKTTFPDLAELAGSFTATTVTVGSGESAKSSAALVYTTSNGKGNAVWVSENSPETYDLAKHGALPGTSN